MALKTRNILKTYFETGDKPTQSEFEDLIDTMVTPEDAIPDGSITINKLDPEVVLRIDSQASGIELSTLTDEEIDSMFTD